MGHGQIFKEAHHQTVETVCANSFCGRQAVVRVYVDVNLDFAELVADQVARSMIWGGFRTMEYLGTLCRRLTLLGVVV